MRKPEQTKAWQKTAYRFPCANKKFSALLPREAAGFLTCTVLNIYKTAARNSM
jgi:hypothetical protein